MVQSTIEVCNGSVALSVAQPEGNGNLILSFKGFRRSAPVLNRGVFSFVNSFA